MANFISSKSNKVFLRFDSANKDSLVSSFPGIVRLTGEDVSAINKFKGLTFGWISEGFARRGLCGCGVDPSYLMIGIDLLEFVITEHRSWCEINHF